MTFQNENDFLDDLDLSRLEGNNFDLFLSEDAIETVDVVQDENPTRIFFYHLGDDNIPVPSPQPPNQAQPAVASGMNGTSPPSSPSKDGGSMSQFVKPDPDLPVNADLLRFSSDHCSSSWQYNRTSKRTEIQRTKTLILEFNSVTSNQEDYLEVRVQHADHGLEGEPLKNCGNRRHCNETCPESPFAVSLPKNPEASITAYVDAFGHQVFRVDNLVAVSQISMVFTCLSTDAKNRGLEEAARLWSLNIGGSFDHARVQQSIPIQVLTMLRSTDRLKGRRKRERSSGRLQGERLTVKRERLDSGCSSGDAAETSDRPDLASMTHLQLKVFLAELESRMMPLALKEAEAEILRFRIAQIL